MAKAKGGRKSARSAKGVACCDEGCCGAGSSCCGLPASDCCRVEAVVGVDGRGQMVLPKDVRELAGIRADEKLAVVAWKDGDQVCCLGLVKVDDLADAVRRTYGPMLSELARS